MPSIPAASSRWAGEYPLEQRAAVTLAPDAATRLAAFPRATWSDPQRSLAFAVLRQGDRLLARNRLILPFFKDLAWSPAQVTVSVSDGQATFLSPTFTWGLCLDLDGETPLSDSFFDLYPNQPYTLPWPGPTPPRILRTGNLA